MESADYRPHFFFLPFMANGHMLPMVNMAKHFVLRGARVSIVTTELNVAIVLNSAKNHPSVDVLSFKFPAAEVGLPEGLENINVITSVEGTDIELVDKFFSVIPFMRDPVEQLLREHKPDCLIADFFFDWAVEASSRFDIPTLCFHGTCIFSMYTSECIHIHNPFANVSSDSDPVLLPHIPGNITLTKNQLIISDKITADGVVASSSKTLRVFKSGCYGVVFNSFYELETVYADLYKTMLDTRIWCVGPVSFFNHIYQEQPVASSPASEYLQWLSSRKPNSVIYISFGSVANLPGSQLQEIAMALESAGHDFIWVVRKPKGDDGLPERFEERIASKGIIVRDWAPQQLILEHEAVGGFVTHCGWNSTLEGIAAGKSLVTWPVSAEQFYNEKLVTEVLKVGVPVGARKVVWLFGDSIEKVAIEKAMDRIMVGEEAEEMRVRVRSLAKLAKEAVEDGGSSCNSLRDLIHEIRSQAKSNCFLENDGNQNP